MSTSDNVNSVQSLKAINVAKLSLAQKIEIRNLGRPKPVLQLLQLSHSRTRKYRRQFKIELYQRTDWICGCSATNGLFCFPCLLFSRGHELKWTRAGVTDLGHLTISIKRHEQSSSHICAQLEMRLLGKQDIRQQLDSTYRRNVQQHNEQAKKHRYVLSKVIDCIKFCGAFELALRENDGGSSPGIFRSFINFSTELDVALKDHIDNSSVFSGASETIQNDLLDCMLEVLQETIKNEIKNAQYVSIIADETTDVSTGFQMAVVLRYILPNGSPVERFWTLMNPSGEKVLNLSECIGGVLKEVLDKPEKLISQSYDGATVLSGSYSGIQHLIKTDYKYGFYVHCYAHEMNLVLAKAASQNQQVRVFFSNLSDITSFFAKSPERLALLDEMVAFNTTWNFKNQTVSTVYENREMLIDCMEKIEESSKQTVVINEASAISRMLQDSTFVFWLNVFYRLMPQADVLYKQLQTITIEPEYIKNSLICFEDCIEIQKNGIGSLGTELNEVSQFSRKRKNEDPYVSKILVAKEVCDTIVGHVKERFSFTNHLSASTLLLSEKFNVFNKVFPTQCLDAAIEAYPLFDKSRLRTELEVIYKRPDFRNMSGAVNLLKFLIENQLQGVFSETFKLLQVIITIPMPTTEGDRCFSTLKRIKTFLRSAMTEEKLTALAMLSIEKELTLDLMNFNDLVIDKFCAKKANSMTSFTFKHCS